jgi:hypothetical protein
MKMFIVLFIFVSLNTSLYAVTQREWLTGQTRAHCGNGVDKTQSGVYKSHTINGERSNGQVRCEPEPESTCFQVGFDGLGDGWYVDLFIPAMGAPPPGSNDIIYTLEFYEDERECWHADIVVAP